MQHHSTPEAPEFTPPPPKGMSRALIWALLVHLLLLLALAWGLNWRHDDGQQGAVNAELWALQPEQSAPKAAPPPPPERQPEPAPPEPQVRPPEPPLQDDARIALEQKKQKEEAARKAAAEKKAAEEAEARQQRKQQEEAEKKKEAERKKAADAAAAEAARREALERINRLAGGDGSAARNAGGPPSAGYAGKLAARVRPNIVFPDDISGNPEAVVEVRTGPGGTILSWRLTRSSGVPSWDAAVLRAIEKTGTLPPDVNGKVPEVIPFGFRPRDF
ncbi:MAG: cell envelope integrity protein TolA [Burkholderiaceae bacterium]|jgi:colicin import membrane protein|nr:cell envelope integrity protein TolA [Burkholderiaceae bacterium]